MSQDIDYLGALRRNWIIGVIVFLASLGAAIAITATQQPIFESSAQLIVAPAMNGESVADAIRSLETLERRTVVATFARIPATPEARAAVAERLGIARRQASSFRITASVVPNTNIVRVATAGPDPKLAAAIANAAAELTAVRAHALYRVYTLEVLSRAEPPSRPAYPDRQRNLLVGGAAGVFLALVAMLAADRLRRGRPRGEQVT